MHTGFIQFIGTQRSGSNLLRLMLNQLPEIAAPHPPHLLRTFVPIAANYADLTERSKRVQLAAHMCELVARNPVRWLAGVPAPEALVDAAPTPDLAGLFVGLYQYYAQQQGAAWACCKSMANIAWYQQLEATSVAPRYIHMVRDGRDVASSFQRTIIGPKHPFAIGRKWRNEQEACLALAGQLGNRVYRIHYEALLANPEQELQQLCSWLGVRYHERMLHYYESQASQETASSGRMWQNVAKPMLTQNTGNYRRRLSLEDLLLFEAQTAPTLEKLGYASVTKAADRPTVTPDMEAVFTLLDETLRAEARTSAPPADQQNRAAYNQWIEQISQSTSNPQ